MTHPCPDYYSSPIACTLLLLVITTFVAKISNADVFEIFPSNADASCNEEFENLANSLQPGDELILHGGIYTQSCGRKITVIGSSSQPITIRAAFGQVPILTRPADNIDTQNNIEIINSQFLIMQGLEFSGGSIGVRFMGNTEDVTLENNKIYNTGNNALTANSGNSLRLTLRGNEIFDTGNSGGSTEGEGMYLGCNNNNCRVTDSLIEKNYIHDLRATSSGGNDGIEIKVGSGGNIVRNNLIHDTTIGTAYPCIFAYGGAAPNIIEHNTLFNCGQAIQIVTDAIVRNNVIYNSQIEGITAAPHSQAGHPADLSITNNTIYGHPTCMFLRLNSATNVVIANNALYCDGSTAINAQGIGNATLTKNYVSGSLIGASLATAGIIDGGAATDQFVDAGNLDFKLRATSILVDSGSDAIANLATVDMNGLPRPLGTSIDVGAYEIVITSDPDGDGIDSSVDNCREIANADQRDSDNDGFGNRCDPDLNNDMIVNFADVGLFANWFQSTASIADFSGDGVVNFLDLNILAGFFLLPPGPGATGTL